MVSALLTLAIVASFFSKPVVGEIIAFPLRLITQGVRAVFAAVGGAFLQAVRDIHDYCYANWLGYTVLFYITVVAVLFLIGLVVNVG